MGGDGGDGGASGVGLFGRLIALLLAEKGGIGLAAQESVPADAEQFVDALTGAARPAAPAAGGEA